MNKLYIERNGITAIHPAFYLKDMIDEEIYTIEELKSKLNLDSKTFTKLLNGKISFNKTIIEKLSNAFETSNEIWENLQKEYEKELKRLEETMPENKFNIFSENSSIINFFLNKTIVRGH